MGPMNAFEVDALLEHLVQRTHLAQPIHMLDAQLCHNNSKIVSSKGASVINRRLLTEAGKTHR